VGAGAVNGDQEPRLFGGEAAFWSSGGEMPFPVSGGEAAFLG